jgi:hypothetical protein
MSQNGKLRAVEVHVKKLSIFAMVAACAILGCQTAQYVDLDSIAIRNIPGAPSVQMLHSGKVWTVYDKAQRRAVTLDASDLAITVANGSTVWRMAPSAMGDLVVKSGGNEFPLRLADAGQVEVEPYQTGFLTGMKVTLSHWHHGFGDLDLRVVLMLGMEGEDEEVVFNITADEGDAVVRQLDWPGALEAGDVDYTVLPNVRGVLLPRDWPKPYFPIRAANPDGSAKASDVSVIQSNVIESWSMSWWGFEKNASAMMVVIETPNDAAYQFNHPAGGPTVIGPRWRATLGRFGYPRQGRFIFLTGNYVDMAKRYRQYAIDHGFFVSMAEKVFRQPRLGQVIGVPMVRLSILTNIARDSQMFSTTQPSRNYRLNTFDERAEQLDKLKAQGLDHLTIALTGWPNMGYDRQHPDEMPPAPAAGGYEGMKRLADECKKLGYVFSLHDQYRDYYVDAPSYDPEFAVHEEDDSNPSTEFPGSRFGQTKEGQIPFMDHWMGGKQAYLNNRYMLGHLKANYQLLFDHGIHPDGIYLDVFGYVPPDEDFNPDHPTSRTQAIQGRVDCFNWAMHHIGFVGTEAGCDWTVPYADYITPLRANRVVPVPLYELVYHDAIMVEYSPDDLRGFLNAGLPTLGLEAPLTPELVNNVRRMAALNKRLAMVEMVDHEFLNAQRTVERTTYADGTTVTVDWEKKSVEILPDVTP